MSTKRSLEVNRKGPGRDETSDTGCCGCRDPAGLANPGAGGSVGSAWAADPGTSGLSAKLSGFGGTHGNSTTGNDGLGGLAGSIVVPIGLSLGAQADGAYGRLGASNFYNSGMHLFWRDPHVAMLGVYGGWAHLDTFGGQDLGRIAAEAELYRGMFTFSGAAGYRFGDVQEQAFGKAKIDYYLNEDLKFSGGYLFEGRSFGSAGLEYQFATTTDAGFTLYAEGRVSDANNYTVLGGLRVFPGDSMTLKNRHRRQDPESYLDVDLEGTSQAAAHAKSLQSGTQTAASACMLFSPKSDLCKRSLQCFLDNDLAPADPQYAACGCAAAAAQCPL